MRMEATTAPTTPAPTAVAPSDYKRSAKKLHNAATTHGWVQVSSVQNYTAAGEPWSVTATYMMEDTDVYLPVEAERGNYTHRDGMPKWLCPVRVELNYDPETFAYLGGKVLRRTWGDERQQTDWHRRPSDAEDAITYPQRALEALQERKQAEADRTAEREQLQARQEQYKNLLRAKSDFGWTRLVAEANHVVAAPEVDPRYDVSRAVHNFERYLELRLTQELAAQAVKVVGRPARSVPIMLSTPEMQEQDEVLMTPAMAVEYVALEGMGSYAHRGAEAQYTEAVRKLRSAVGSW